MQVLVFIILMSLLHEMDCTLDVHHNIREIAKTDKTAKFCSDKQYMNQFNKLHERPKVKYKTFPEFNIKEFEGSGQNNSYNRKPNRMRGPTPTKSSKFCQNYIKQINYKSSDGKNVNRQQKSSKGKNMRNHGKSTPNKMKIKCGRSYSNGYKSPHCSPKCILKLTTPCIPIDLATQTYEIDKVEIIINDPNKTESCLKTLCVVDEPPTTIEYLAQHHTTTSTCQQNTTHCPSLTSNCKPNTKQCSTTKESPITTIECQPNTTPAMISTCNPRTTSFPTKTTQCHTILTQYPTTKAHPTKPPEYQTSITSYPQTTIKPGINRSRNSKDKNVSINHYTNIVHVNPGKQTGRETTTEDNKGDDSYCEYCHEGEIKNENDDSDEEFSKEAGAKNNFIKCDCNYCKWSHSRKNMKEPNNKTESSDFIVHSLRNLENEKTNKNCLKPNINTERPNTNKRVYLNETKKYINKNMKPPCYKTGILSEDGDSFMKEESVVTNTNFNLNNNIEIPKMSTQLYSNKSKQINTNLRKKHKCPKSHVHRKNKIKNKHMRICGNNSSNRIKFQCGKSHQCINKYPKYTPKFIPSSTTQWSVLEQTTKTNDKEKVGKILNNPTSCPFTPYCFFTTTMECRDCTTCRPTPTYLTATFVTKPLSTSTKYEPNTYPITSPSNLTYPSRKQVQTVTCNTHHSNTNEARTSKEKNISFNYFTSIIQINTEKKKEIQTQRIQNKDNENDEEDEGKDENIEETEDDGSGVNESYEDECTTTNDELQENISGISKYRQSENMELKKFKTLAKTKPVTTSRKDNVINKAIETQNTIECECNYWKRAQKENRIQKPNDDIEISEIVIDDYKKKENEKTNLNSQKASSNFINCKTPKVNGYKQLKDLSEFKTDDEFIKKPMERKSYKMKYLEMVGSSKNDEQKGLLDKNIIEKLTKKRTVSKNEKTGNFMPRTQSNVKQATIYGSKIGNNTKNMESGTSEIKIVNKRKKVPKTGKNKVFLLPNIKVEASSKYFVKLELQMKNMNCVPEQQGKVTTQVTNIQAYSLKEKKKDLKDFLIDANTKSNLEGCIATTDKYAENKLKRLNFRLKDKTVRANLYRASTESECSKENKVKPPIHKMNCMDNLSTIETDVEESDANNHGKNFFQQCSHDQNSKKISWDGVSKYLSNIGDVASKNKTYAFYDLSSELGKSTSNKATTTRANENNQRNNRKPKISVEKGRENNVKTLKTIVNPHYRTNCVHEIEDGHANFCKPDKNSPSIKIKTKIVSKNDNNKTTDDGLVRNYSSTSIVDEKHRVKAVKNVFNGKNIKADEIATEINNEDTTGKDVPNTDNNMKDQVVNNRYGNIKNIKCSCGESKTQNVAGSREEFSDHISEKDLTRQKATLTDNQYNDAHKFINCILKTKEKSSSDTNNEISTHCENTTKKKAKYWLIDKCTSTTCNQKKTGLTINTTTEAKLESPKTFHTKETEVSYELNDTTPNINDEVKASESNQFNTLKDYLANVLKSQCMTKNTTLCTNSTLHKGITEKCDNLVPQNNKQLKKGKQFDKKETLTKVTNAKVPEQSTIKNVTAVTHLNVQSYKISKERKKLKTKQNKIKDKVLNELIINLIEQIKNEWKDIEFDNIKENMSRRQFGKLKSLLSENVGDKKNMEVKFVMNKILDKVDDELGKEKKNNILKKVKDILKEVLSKT